MQSPKTTFISKSGQLGFSLHTNPNFLAGHYKDLSQVSTEEYLDYFERFGVVVHESGTGRLMMDFSQMKGFNLSLRAIAVNNLNRLIVEKAPFLVLAIIKSGSLFENLATQTTLKMALPLSSKLLAGEMFDNTDAGRRKALDWLAQYKVPQECTNI